MHRSTPRQRIISLFVTLFATGLAAGPLAAHGGQYRGPGDAVPPSQGGGDTPPPAKSVTTGSDTARPLARPTGQGGLSRKGRLGGFAKRGGGEGFEQWEFWWATNKEPFRARATSSGSLGHLLARRRRLLSTNRATPQDVTERIVPSLLAVLDADDADLVDSAVLALARTVPAAQASLVLQPIVKTLAHPQETARQSAALALGVLGSPEARPYLHDLAADTPRGRRLLGAARSVPGMIRGFAALSIGMIGHPDDPAFLMERIDDLPDTERDLKSCALVALGLFPTRQLEIASYLVTVMNRSGIDRILRAQAPISLSRLRPRIAATAGLPPILRALRAAKTDNDLTRSSIIALGKIATIEDSQALALLFRTIRDHADAQSRHFAYIALAEIGARDSSDFDRHATTHQQLLDLFLRDLRNPRRKPHLPWSALALGLYVRPFRGQYRHAPLLKTAVRQLGDSFDATNNPSYKGAIAIALGLIEATEEASHLMSALESTDDAALASHLAVSLGLMGYDAATPLLRQIMARKGQDWFLRLNIARALGLLNDVQSLSSLTSALDEAGTIYETASLAQAIGLIGDRRAIPNLQHLVADEGRPGLLRGFAAVAQGLLAEKTPMPWNARIAVGSNYRAKTSALSEAVDIL